MNSAPHLPHETPRTAQELYEIPSEVCFDGKVRERFNSSLVCLFVPAFDQGKRYLTSSAHNPDSGGAQMRP